MSVVIVRHRRKCNAYGKSIPFSGSKAEKLKQFRECDKSFLMSLLSPLMQSDEIEVENLLRADTGKWVELDRIGGVRPTQTLLRCLRRGQHLNADIMRICCALLQKRDGIICDFYTDVNKSSTSFQARLKSLYLVNTDIHCLSKDLPVSIPLHRIFVVHQRTRK